MRLAAPSFVWPAGLTENCRRLAPDYPEVGLLFLELAPCLAYGEDDLPPDLAGLGLSYHLHLPLDLPFAEGSGPACAAALELVRKTAYLKPWAYVLHPPQSPELLSGFMEHWTAQGRAAKEILLENTAQCGLSELWPQILELGCGVCLDLGHLLAFGQARLLEAPGLWERTRLLHLYAPFDPKLPAELELARGGGHKHRELGLLERDGLEILKKILGRLRPGTVALFEVFNPEGLAASRAYFEKILNTLDTPCSA